MPPFLRAFVDSAVRASEPAYAEWTSHLLLPVARRSLPKVRQLRAIGLDYGVLDQFAHIPAGSEALGRYLRAQGMLVELQAYDGDHFDADVTAWCASPFLISPARWMCGRDDEGSLPSLVA